MSKLFKQEIKFVAGAARINQLPKLSLPQVAFIGKSNVGKSSLINKLFNRKDLARVSHTPGRTQQINFFDLAGKLLVVDLPGYGFAKVSANQRNVWEVLIAHYLAKTPSLKIINLLIDSRRGLKEHDIVMIDFLREKDLPFQIIFTKIDDAKSVDELIADTKQILDLHGCGHVDILTSSSKKASGIREIQQVIAKYCL